MRFAQGAVKTYPIEPLDQAHAQAGWHEVFDPLLLLFRDVSAFDDLGDVLSDRSVGT